MKKILSLLVVAACFCACQKQKTVKEINPDTEKEVKLTTDAVAVDNALTTQEQSEGWTLLFDGKTMNHWRFFKNKENNSWEIADGTLHCKAFEVKGSEKRADLITTEQYEDFEFSCQWKVQRQSNSGVMFRVTEEFDEPYASGPEYQILDDAAYTDVQESNFTACVFGMYPVGKKKLHPAGEWNQSKIISKQNHIEHWLNDEKVLEYEINSKQWNDIKQGGKWKGFPGYGKSARGHVALQDHGNEVWFKNVKIKTL